MQRKGIVLAGGAGTRLAPLTSVISKQLLPIYNKPMIYYPLSVLMLAGIRDVLIISTPDDLPLFQRLLGDGSRLGMRFEYAAQDKPDGLPQAFQIGADFIAGQPAALILGDNIFYGNSVHGAVKEAGRRTCGATIFAHPVRDPERYGIVEFDHRHRPCKLIEKPREPRSNYAVVGLYFVDNQVVRYANQLQPSARGELEILDLIQIYLEQDQLDVEILGRGVAWLDAGTHRSLLQAATFVETIEERQGTMIACLEEIAFRNRFIDREQLLALAKKMGKTEYGRYLHTLAKEKTEKSNH